MASQGQLQQVQVATPIQMSQAATSQANQSMSQASTSTTWTTASGSQTTTTSQADNNQNATATLLGQPLTAMASLQLPNGQIIQGQIGQLLGAGAGASFWPMGALNMPQLGGMRSSNIIQVQGLPGGLQGIQVRLRMLYCC